ncbi:MAG TPA: hypothetical protein VNI01_03605, partial [Elusimicrobiota bacterium]|nr:hypothetical protein [Elusimicrobiota bacterium]
MRRLRGLLCAAVLLAPPVRAQDSDAPDPGRAVRAEFWGAIGRLDRRHADSGEPVGPPSLVEEIRGDVAALGDELALDTMERFLDISRHYRAMQDPAADAAARAEETGRFRAGLEEFRSLALEQYSRRGDATLMRFFAHVRDLAVSGPDGLALSRELARVDPNNAAVQRSLSR